MKWECFDCQETTQYCIKQTLLHALIKPGLFSYFQMPSQDVLRTFALYYKEKG